MSEPEFSYEGADLEAMEMASNYRAWIFELIKPFFGEHLVEVGAGAGAFSEMLLGVHPRTLQLVEPSEMFDRLEPRFRSHTGETRLETFKGIFADVADEIVSVQPPDTIIYINVLEHVEDDPRELELLYRTLQPGGHLILFVPALQFLLSAFDRSIGHFRRYSKKDLLEKCKSAGFDIGYARYFDFLGIFPWAIKYRLLGSLKMEPAAVKLYDRFAVPPLRFLEDRLPPPVGKNLLVVARKQL